MNIKDIPSDYDTCERFNVQYGRDPFACTPATAAVATATRDMFLGWFLPKFLSCKCLAVKVNRSRSKTRSRANSRSQPHQDLVRRPIC